MNIPVPRAVPIITAVFAAIIPTIVGLITWISPDNAPLAADGAHDLLLSWGARSLGLAVAGWVALLVIRDARGYVVALGANATREILDLIDLIFRNEDPSTPLYFMLTVSSTSLTVALALSLRAVIRDRAQQSNAASPLATPASS
ncbi:MAG: hypothetical protein R8J94_21525 [Acidimicrobiia bacterium]|nr:hypothetical protein [Acidimicrobiia bacterium]